MKTLLSIFSLVIGILAFYFSCTKDTHFNPTEEIGVTIEAFVCDTTDLDTTIILADSLTGTVTAISVYAGQTITFLGFIKGDSVNDLTWSWDFGDTITSASRIAEHRYMTAGEYKSVFTITNSVGVSLSDTVTISVSAIQQKAAVMGYAYLEGKSDHTGIQVKFINKISSETIILETQKNGLFKVISNFSNGLYNVYYNDTLFKAFSPVTITDVSIIKGIMNELGKVILEDKQKPYIINNSPTGTVDDTRLPSIKTAFIDSASGIAPETFLLIFNSDTIADSLINCDTSGFSWTTAARLPDGNYSVHASICDSAGNMKSITWSFRVDAMKLTAYGDTTVSIYDSVNLYGRVENVYSKVEEYKWDFDGNGTWDDSINTSDTIISVKYSYPNDTTYKVILYAKDDSNMVKYDTIEVIVLQDNPIVNLGNDTILSINDSIRINGTVSDSFGTIISMEWNFGSSGFVPTNSSDTTFVTPGVPEPNYICILRVEDDDGNVVKDSLKVDVKLDPPEAVIVAPDSAKVDSNFTVSSSNSSPGNFGYIAKYEWSVGSYNNFKETSEIDTMINTTSEETDSFIVVLKVTDDDGNLDLDTDFIFIARIWDVVGTKGFSDGYAGDVSIALDNNNIPFVAYRDGANENKVTVKKYNGTSWESVGIDGFTDDAAMYISLSIDNKNIPYIGYVKELVPITPGKLSVMIFNATSWEYLGIKGFSDGNASCISLSIDGDNIPYVAYSDMANGAHSTVMKYGGTSWGPVGNKGFSDGSASYISLSIDGDNIPYVAYRENANDYKATVMKYSGTSWEAVGNKGFSDGNATYVSLAIDGNNILYVAYSDVANGSKSTVMKYSGTSWEPVGNKGFSDGNAMYVSLSIDGNNIPFVAYQDMATAGLATVMKYSGASWEPVGNKGFSDGNALSVSIAIDSNNIPYVVFSDESVGGKVTVMRYR